MKKIINFSLIVLLSFTLAACGNSKKATSQTKETDASETAESSSAKKESKTSQGEDASSELKYSETVETNWSEEWQGMTINIPRAQVIQYNEPQDYQDGMKTTSVIAVVFDMTNNSGSDITTNPNQGKIIIDGKQYNADINNSNTFENGTIGAGKNSQGIIVYPITDIDDISKVSTIRVLWSASSPTTNASKTFDVELKLTK